MPNIEDMLIYAAGKSMIATCTVCEESFAPNHKILVFSREEISRGIHWRCEHCWSGYNFHDKMMQPRVRWETIGEA